jgi:hypothetical protein
MRQPGNGDARGGVVGGRVDVEARLRRELSLFATGRVGHLYGDRGDRMTYEALLGIAKEW